MVNKVMSSLIAALLLIFLAFLIINYSGLQTAKI